MNDNPMLQTLGKHRDLILLAEIGALIHDLGKLSKEFIENINMDAPDWHNHILRLHDRCEEDPQVTAFECARTAREFAQSILTSQELIDFLDRRWEEFRERKADDLVNRLKAELTDIPRCITVPLLSQGIPRDEIETHVHDARESVLSGWEECIRQVKAKATPTGLAFKRAELQILISEMLGGKMTDKQQECKEKIIEALTPVTEHYRRLELEARVPSDFLPADLAERLYEGSVEIAGSTAKLSHYVEMHHDYHRDVPYLVKLLKARPDEGADGVDSSVDKWGVRNEDRQDIVDTRIATAFGHEPDSLRINTGELKQVRHQYADDLALILQRISPKQAKSPEFWKEVLYDGWQTNDDHFVPGLRKLTESAFRQALGETRRAANDVTLWDHSFSVAGLYKAALAKILLEQARNPSYTLPKVKDIHWRLLRVGYGGLGYLERAHHVTDLLGRKTDLEHALDQVKQALEVTFPLGNEIYRDENGSAFLVPALDRDEGGQDIVALIGEVVHQAFLEHLGGEIRPTLSLSEPSREAVELGELLAKPALLWAEPGPIQQSWQGWAGTEICPICGLRPCGYVEPNLPPFANDSEKAKQRHMCGVCLARRGRRSQHWAKNEDGLLTRTIWIDEAVDEHGRLALVVGRFGLENWLNGKYVNSLLASPGHPKYPSFARLRRTWETTRGFWQEVEKQILNQVLREEEKRLELTPDPPILPGNFHVYEARYSFGDVPVVWDPDTRRLITATNLRTLGPSANLEGRVTLYEPSGSGRATVRAGDFWITNVERSATPYKPYISLLTEPSVYMALVPASRALEAAYRIRDRYEEEMSRVRDRLPLYLGLVFFHRRTPLYAALNAGRRMLASPKECQMWTVKETGDDDQRRIVFRNDVVWPVPLRMGDGQTPDKWYLGSLRSASAGEQIQVYLSHFDYVFLDASARRFDVRLDEATRRRPHPLLGLRHSPRPYLLEDLRRMEQVWQWCWPAGMTITKLYGVCDLLTGRFQEWGLSRKDRTAQEWDTYTAFVEQVIRKEFAYRSGEAYDLLKRAMLDGLFFDCLELHLQIMKEKGVGT